MWTRATTTKIITEMTASIVVKFAVSVLNAAVAIAVTFVDESTMLVNAAEAVWGATAAGPAAAEIADFESVAVRRPASTWWGLAGRSRAPQRPEARLDCPDAIAAITMVGNATNATKLLLRFDAINLQQHSAVASAGNNSLHLPDPGAKMLC